MTVKFFPVFFEQECKFSPAIMQAVFASVTLFLIPGTLICQKMAKRFGRLQIIISCFLVGIPCTMLMGLLRSFYSMPGVMLPIFLMRCVSQWSCGALMGSVIADYTPKAQRAR